MSSVNVVVVGGGVMGAAIAQSLARRGVPVIVVERGEIGAKPGASGASAALLEPLAGVSESLVTLAKRSLTRMPGLCAALAANTDYDPAWTRPGSMILARSAREATWVRNTRAAQFHAVGEDAVWLSGHEARLLEPAIGTDVVGALRIPATQSVYAPSFTRALLADAQAHGAIVATQTTVTGFRRMGRRVIAVDTTAGEYACTSVVIAAGAWSRMVTRLLGEDQDDLLVAPQKGQILAIAPRAGVPPVSHVLHGAGGYAVPKPNGTILVGATHDDVGFDATLTAAGLRELGNLAHDLVPGIVDEPIRHVWAGFRPVWRGDGPPPLGVLPGMMNVLVATGHGAVGVTVSAGVGEVIADLIVS